MFTQLVDGGLDKRWGLEGVKEDDDVSEGEEGATLSICNMSPSSSIEVMASEGVCRELELISPAVSKGGMRSEIPLTIRKASASQNSCMYLVLRYWKDPLAVLALWLYECNKCQHMQTIEKMSCTYDVW